VLGLAWRVYTKQGSYGADGGRVVDVITADDVHYNHIGAVNKDEQVLTTVTGYFSTSARLPQVSAVDTGVLVVGWKRGGLCFCFS